MHPPAVVHAAGLAVLLGSIVMPAVAASNDDIGQTLDVYLVRSQFNF